MNNCFVCDEPCGQAMMCVACRAKESPRHTGARWWTDAGDHLKESLDIGPEYVKARLPPIRDARTVTTEQLLLDRAMYGMALVHC